MSLPKNKLKEAIGDNGIFYKNPTHTEEAEFASDQGSLVKAITGAKRPKNTLLLEYTEESMPWVLPGFSKIRDLNDEAREGLFKSLLRYRPNTFNVHIALGDYQNQKPLNSAKVRVLNFDEPHFHSEIAQKIADVFNDRSYCVTELIFTISNVESGNYTASCQAYYVEQEDYDNNELFNPAIKLGFFLNI